MIGGPAARPRPAGGLCTVLHRRPGVGVPPCAVRCQSGARAHEGCEPARPAHPTPDGGVVDVITPELNVRAASSTSPFPFSKEVQGRTGSPSHPPLSNRCSAAVRPSAPSLPNFWGEKGGRSRKFGCLGRQSRPKHPNFRQINGESALESHFRFIANRRRGNNKASGGV